MKTTLVTLALVLSGPALAQEVNGGEAPPVRWVPTEQTSQAEREVERLVARIAEIDDAGPTLNAVISINPSAVIDARAAHRSHKPLDGLTVLVKDNIETREMPTTAGSLTLADNMTGRDAPLIARLRGMGGVVLGKTNMSEWANIRDMDATSGWSAVGGLTRNPHALDRTACGSSSGSGAAIAAGLAWAAIGTETNGSITCPASVNGIVGFKPSVGLVSRTHIVPISSTQDTAGPMARNVHDAAALLTAIAGEDPTDPATQLAPQRVRDYTWGLQAASLSGVRIGVLRQATGDSEEMRAVFETALADLERAGAVLVDVAAEPDPQMYQDSFLVLMYELREGMKHYLESLPGNDHPRSLADLIAFNAAHRDQEMRWFGQNLFELAESTTDKTAYEAARANAVRIAGAETLDKLLVENDLKFLIAPTTAPAGMIDLVNGDHFVDGVGFGSPAAIAGYPHLTVPMGAVHGLPVGLSFFGPKWSDHEVLKAGAAYERARSAALPEPAFRNWAPPPASGE